MKQPAVYPAVYIVTNKKNGVLYTGVTSNLIKRIYEHKHSITRGFTAKYNCKLLVFFEIHYAMESAINREKRIKAGTRDKKVQLIEEFNSDWKDLYDGIV